MPGTAGGVRRARHQIRGTSVPPAPTGADRFPQALEVIADGDEDVQHHGSSAQRIPATGTSPIRHRRPQMPRTSVLSHDFWDVSGCAGAWATMSRLTHDA